MNGNVDAATGTVSSDGLTLACPGMTPRELEALPGYALQAESTGPGFTTYGPLNLRMEGKQFVVGVRFFGQILHGVTLTWKQGRVASMGYDAEEKDLLAEKKQLTALLTRQLGTGPSSSSLGADVFEFDWGAVVSRADLKSTWAGIEIRYL